MTTCEGRVGNVVEIDCQFNYTLNQSLSYHWWKDGNNLNKTSKSIVFDLFNPSDAGRYRCEVHDDDDDDVIFCGRVQLKVG